MLKIWLRVKIFFESIRLGVSELLNLKSILGLVCISLIWRLMFFVLTYMEYSDHMDKLLIVAINNGVETERPLFFSERVWLVFGYPNMEMVNPTLSDSEDIVTVSDYADQAEDLNKQHVIQEAKAPEKAPFLPMASVAGTSCIAVYILWRLIWA